MINLRNYILLLILLLPSLSHANSDPFEDINKKTHNLNQTLDLQVASPVARFYKRITPDILEIGITNFTRNIEDLSIALNNMLQGKVNEGISDLFRFTINSTLGIAGFIDVSTGLGFEKHDEDFGQTLAIWGVDEGPYLSLIHI